MYSNSGIITGCCNIVGIKYTILVYLAVEIGNILSIFYFLKDYSLIVTNISCGVSAKQDLCELSEIRYSTRVMPKSGFLSCKNGKRYFVNVQELCLL